MEQSTIKTITANVLHYTRALDCYFYYYYYIANLSVNLGSTQITSTSVVVELYLSRFIIACCICKIV